MRDVNDMWDFIGAPDAKPTWMQGFWEGFAAATIICGALAILVAVAMKS